MSDPAQPPPSLLDELRAKSDVLRERVSASRKPVEEALQDIDQRLWKAFRWLDEALGHLEVIRPIVARRFQLGNILTIAQPRFDRGFVSFRKRSLAGLELLDHIEMFYRLVGSEPIVLRVNPGGATAIEERLRASTLQFQYQTEQDDKRVVRYGLFHVQPVISASVRLQPDYHRQVIDVTLRNVDRFESVSLEFPPDKISEPVLENLVQFLLGEANTFLHRAPLAGFHARRDHQPLTEKARQRA